MNPTTHLTSAELDALLFQPEAAAAHPHLLSCAVCAADLSSLRATFADLRSGATAAAAHHQQLAQSAAQRSARSASRSRYPMRLIGSFATAALALAIGLPIVLHHPAAPAAPNVASSTHRPETATASAANLSNLSDDQLLTSIQSDLSASVPDPMLPLDDNTSTQSK